MTERKTLSSDERWENSDLLELIKIKAEFLFHFKSSKDARTIVTDISNWVILGYIEPARASEILLEIILKDNGEI